MKELLWELQEPAVGVLFGTGARAEQQRDRSWKKPEVILLPEPGEKLKHFVFTSQNDALFIGSWIIVEFTGDFRKPFFSILEWKKFWNNGNESVPPHPSSVKVSFCIGTVGDHLSRSERVAHNHGLEELCRAEKIRSVNHCWLVPFLCHVWSKQWNVRRLRINFKQ